MFLRVLEVSDLKKANAELQSLAAILRDKAIAVGRLRTDALYSSFPEELIKRIQSCRGSYRSNCIGTALYITGKIRRDHYVDPEIAYKAYLQNLANIDIPVPGSLVVWQRVEEKEIVVKHMGVITAVKPNTPVLVTHRAEVRGKLIENQPLFDAVKDHTRTFYLVDGSHQGVLSDAWIRYECYLTDFLSGRPGGRCLVQSFAGH